MGLVGCPAHLQANKGITEEEANFAVGGSPVIPEPVWNSETQRLSWFNFPEDGWVFSICQPEGKVNFMLEVGTNRYEQLQELFAMQNVTGRMVKNDYPIKGWSLAFTDADADGRFDQTKIMAMPQEFLRLAVKNLEDHRT